MLQQNLLENPPAPKTSLGAGSKCLVAPRLETERFGGRRGQPRGSAASLVVIMIVIVIVVVIVVGTRQ